MIVHDFSTISPVCTDSPVQAIIQDYRVLLYRFVMLIVKYSIAVYL